MRLGAFLLVLFLSGPLSAADVITVAVASNFKPTAIRIADRFRQQTGHTVRLSSGSTGKLYAQIVNGAPFDVFLAADAERPARLERDGRAVGGSRFTYAIGSLVIYSRSAHDCLAALRDPQAGYVAIANPETAPYGRAAEQYLARSGLEKRVAPRLVYGENIAQAWQFAFTGNAVVAIVARAQLQSAPGQPACVSTVPSGDHDPLNQQAVLLSADSGAAARFLEFLRSAAAREIIVQDGYEVPE